MKKDEWILGDKMLEMANKILDWKGNKQSDDEVIVSLSIPEKYIDMLDELAILDADGNRTQMFIKLIEKQYRIKKDFQRWQSEDEIRRAIRDSFKKKEKEEYDN